MIGTEPGHYRVLQTLGEGGPPPLACFDGSELRRGLAEAQARAR
jgi:hypothetical protein